MRFSTARSSLVQRLGQADLKEHDWISHRMVDVRKALNERDDAVKVLLTGQGTSSPSGWDSDVLSIHYSSIEAVSDNHTNLLLQQPTSGMVPVL
jgi:hypothetical protein